MALSISGIVSAVNNYLYSISDVAKATSEDSNTTDLSGISLFQKYLNIATQNSSDSSGTEEAEKVTAVNTDSNSDASADTVTVASDNASGGVDDDAAVTQDTLSEEINSVFNELDIESTILNNISNRSVDISSEITNNIASHTVDVKAEILQNMAEHGAELSESAISAVGELAPSSTATDGDSTANSNAYNGLLSQNALKELAQSAYFSGNLLQNTLISGTSESSTSSSGDLTLADLNSNSLTANTLGAADTTLSQSEYAAALLNAYKTTPITSVFGDFQV